MSKTKLANIFDNLSFVSYILFLTDDLIIKIGKQRLTEIQEVPAHTSYTPHSLYTFHPLTLSVGFKLTINQGSSQLLKCLCQIDKRQFRCIGD